MGVAGCKIEVRLLLGEVWHALKASEEVADVLRHMEEPAGGWHVQNLCNVKSTMRYRLEMGTNCVIRSNY
jgi:hypothetical protein